MSSRRGRGTQNPEINRSRRPYNRERHRRHVGGRGASSSQSSAAQQSTSAYGPPSSSRTSEPTRTQAQIPGYHFDSQTNRYYRIVGNHQAATGAISTSEAAERGRASKARSKALIKKYRDQHRFKRSKFSDGSIASTLLHLELARHHQTGATKDNVKAACISDFHGSVKTDKQPRIWLDGDMFMQGEQCTRGLAKLNFHYDPSRRMLMFCLVNQRASTTHFFQAAAFLAALGEQPFRRYITTPILAAEPRGFVPRVLALHCMTCRRPDPNLEALVPPLPRIVFAPDSRYILCLGTRKVLTLTSCVLTPRPNGPHPVNWSPIIIGSLPEELDAIRPQWGLPTMPSDLEITENNMVIDEPDDDLPAWEHICIAIQPDDMYDDSTPLSMHYISGGQGYFSTTNVDLCDKTAVSASSWSASAVTAITYVNAHTWLYGLRNGSICSTNSNENSWRNGSNELARHGGAVVNLHLLRGKQYLIVNGLGNKLYLYRLRANKDFASLGDLSASNMKQAQANQIVAVLKYDHNNAKWPSDQLGFDVCEDLGVIAAAQDDGSIKVFAIFSGMTLATLRAAQAENQGGRDQSGNATPPPMFTTLQIIPDDMGFYHILGARRGRIYDFGLNYD